MLKAAQRLENKKSEISALVGKIRGVCAPKTFRLFGSCAAGTAKELSDIDILLTFDSDEELRRSKKAVYALGLLAPSGVDIVWMLESDYHRKKTIGGVAMVVHQDGIDL